MKKLLLGFCSLFACGNSPEASEGSTNNDIGLESGESGDSETSSESGSGDGEAGEDDAVDPCHMKTKYFLIDAKNDPNVSKSTIDHGLWMPNFFCEKSIARFSFKNAVFYTNGDIDGDIFVSSDGCGGKRNNEEWAISVEFDKLINAVPKKELKNPDFTQPQSVVDQWKFYKLHHGIMWSKTEVNFAELSHFGNPHAFQVGETANGKNMKFGISGWLEYNHIINNKEKKGKGDLNADLMDMCR